MAKFVLLISFILFGCTAKAKPTARASALVATRPYSLKVPIGYSARKPTPLLMLLHGYGSTSASTDFYFGATALANERKVLVAIPNGTADPHGKQFWNATDACCNLYGSTVDDVAYLNALVDDVQSKYNVDTKRIYLVGHSNGGFMANRMACDSNGRFAAIASLAGAQWKDPERCSPTSQVSVLQIHGDADPVISYEGGALRMSHKVYPSAHDTVATWANKNKCTSGLQSSANTLDLEATLPGAETTVDRFGGCPKGGAVELRTIHGGSHAPNFQPTFLSTVYDFLSAHPKP